MDLSKYTTFIFDLDGTLVQSEELKAKAISLAFADLGGDAPPEVYKSVMGSDWNTCIDAFRGAAGINVKLLEFNPIFREKYLQLLNSELKERGGAKLFLERIRNLGLKTCIVTSASPWMAKSALKITSLSSFFDIVITNEDVKKHKPDPECYRLALSKLASKPEESLVFEDSFAGIQSSRQAGCETIFVKHDYNTCHEYSETLVQIDDFNEVVEKL